MELFEDIRREYEFGEGTIAGVARKFCIHRRMVREAHLRKAQFERVLDVFLRLAGGMKAQRRVHVIICGQNHAAVSNFERPISSFNKRAHCTLQKRNPTKQNLKSNRDVLFWIWFAPVAQMDRAAVS